VCLKPELSLFIGKHAIGHFRQMILSAVVGYVVFEVNETKAITMPRKSSNNYLYFATP